MQPSSSGPRAYACLEVWEIGRQLTGRHLFVTATGEELRAASARLFCCWWQELELLIGPKGVEAVMRRALKVATARQPLLQSTTIDVGGPSWAPLNEPPGGEAQAALCAAVGDLFLTSADVMCTLVGIDLVRPILQRLECALAERG